MPGFEDAVVKRREFVRDQAADAQEAALRAEVAALAHTTKPAPATGPQPVLTATLWIEDNPRAGLPFDSLTGSLGGDWAQVREPWAGPLAELAWTAPDVARCWGCGRVVGYTGHETENPGPGALEIWWTVCALVQAADPGSAGSIVTVQCETCAPTADLQPWPEHTAPTLGAAEINRCSQVGARTLHVQQGTKPFCLCGAMRLAGGS